MDASATGTVVGQLAAPVGINELVHVGVVRAQTERMIEILHDPAVTGAVIVTTPEEMPVSEAVDLAGRLSTGDSGPPRLRHRQSCPSRAVREERGGRLRRARPAVGGDAPSPRQIGADPGHLRAVLSAARLAVTIRRDGAAHLEHLRANIAADVPLLNLPYLFGRAHGMRAIRQVASSLGEEL